MKKFVVFSLCFIIFVLVYINQTQQVEAFHQSEINDDLFYDIENIDTGHYQNTSIEGRLFIGSKNNIFVYQIYDRVNYLESGYEIVLRKITNPQKTVRVNLRIDGHLFDGNHLLIWGKKKVGLLYDYVFYKYNYDLVLQEELYLVNVGYASFLDVIKIDGYYYFCGGASGNNHNFIQYNQGKNLNQSDAVVLKMNQTLNIVDMWIYGGTNHERFTNIDVYNNKLILIGEKSSVAPGDFENIGQMNQEKVMLVSIALDGIIDNAMYFDHEAIHEFSNHMIVLDQFAFIHIYIEDVEEHYVYKINLSNFQIIWGIEASQAGNEYFAITQIAIGNTNTVILIGADEFGKLSIMGLQSLDGEAKGLIKINMSFMTSSVSVENGVLELFGDDVQVINNKTEFFAKRIVVDQYHVEKNIDKICSNILCPIEDTSHVMVSSWFGFPQLIERIMQPNFSPNVHGIYDVTYRYQLESQKQIEIESNIIVPFYANIIEDGVYGIGFKPIFTGFATLNNEPFLSGKSINQSGNYQMVITNYGDEIITISFRIESGILYSGDQNTYWNIACEKGEILEIKVSIFNPDRLDILQVFINQTPYPYFEVSSDFETILIDVVAPMIAGIHQIVIDKIEYDYHGDIRSMNIGATAIINVLKTIPSVTLIEENSTNKMISLKAMFIDNDQSIIHMKAILYENNIPIRSKDINLINADFNFENLKTNTSYKATIFIIYNLGDHIRHMVEMVEINFITLKEHISLGSVTITKKGIVLEEAIIQFSKSNSNLLLSSIRIEGNDLIINQSQPQENIIYYVISGASVIIMSTTLIIMKHRKKIKQQ